MAVHAGQFPGRSPLAPGSRPWCWNARPTPRLVAPDRPAEGVPFGRQQSSRGGFRSSGPATGVDLAPTYTTPEIIELSGPLFLSMVPDRIVPVPSSDHSRPTALTDGKSAHRGRSTSSRGRPDPDTYDEALFGILDTLGRVTENLWRPTALSRIAGSHNDVKMTD